jgi:hypothetical protein
LISKDDTISSKKDQEEVEASISTHANTKKISNIG